MGCWNGTCAVSQLHVMNGQRVAVFMLLENKESRSFCYGNALYDLCPVPFYGKYNDYGAVEDCDGFGLTMVVEALRSQLYKFGEGPNSSHDCEVNKENFDIEMLFEADHEDRLGIEHHGRYNSDEYDAGELQTRKEEKGLSDSQAFELDRLVNKIRKVDTFRRVTHVIVHEDILNSILEKWYIEDYVGEKKGNKGYQNSYVHQYFKDVVDSIPEYIHRLKTRGDAKARARETLRAAEAAGVTLDRKVEDALYDQIVGDTFKWDDANLAGKWMGWFKRGSTLEYGLIRVEEVVEEYIEAEDWENLALFAKEVLTTAWLNSFMSHTRKIWTKQTGAGSQNSEPLGYKVLANAVLDVIEAERQEYLEENGEDEDESDH